MSYFSAFWKKHYNDIGFCCTMQPLQESAFAYKNMIRHVVEFMDTQWMINKQLKWIGWDKWDYYAWVAPDGMLYRFEDLPRNEAGKIYEKEERKLQLNPEMPPYPVASQLDFYEWELSVLLDCGFCHDRKSGEVPDGDEKERQGGTGTNVAVPGWEQYASGNVTNTNYATNTGDTTYTGDTAYTNNAPTNYAPPPQQGGQGGSEGRERDYIPRLPYAPPAQLPTQPASQQPATWQPPTQQPPAVRPRTPKQNPVLNTKKVVDTARVGATPPGLNIPFERRKFRYIDQPEEDFAFHDPQENEEHNNKRNEAYFQKLLELINSVADERSNWNWDSRFLPNGKVVEKGFLIAREQERSTRNGKSIVTYKYSTQNGVMGDENSLNWDYFLDKKFEIAGQSHTHPYPGPITGTSAPSDKDINSLRSRKNDFVYLVEGGNKRYALIIEDEAKARDFFAANNEKKIEKLYSLIRKSTRGTFEQQTENAVKTLLRNSGIGFYISNSSKKRFYKQD